VPALVKYANTLPNVIVSHDNLYTCSEAGLNHIKKAIAENNLNRVVVASCTPRTHELLFRNTINEAGLNPYLFEFVNIREQCSWVHMKEKKKATEKAKDLIRMGVARSKFLEPRLEIEVNVTPSALVIGGGIAGMSCALSLAERGFKVILVERKENLGGLLRDLYKLHPDQADATKIVENKIRAIENNKNIEFFVSTIVTEIKGFIGNYEIVLEEKGQISSFKVGVIIVATGAQPFKPLGLYGYNGKTVVTQLELEQILKREEFTSKNIVMIQCVGARTEERSYCSRVCCITALNNALTILDRNPSANIFILYRDLMSYGLNEDLYRKARELGVVFLQYSPQKPPHVNERSVRLFDILVGEDVELPYDLVVLSTPLISHPDSTDLAKMLKVPVDEYGFFLEAHVKLRPLEFATDGIYLCGSAHWPSSLSESIFQAYGAAARSAIPLSRKSVKAEAIIASVNQDQCIACLNCEAACEFGAIRVAKGFAEVNPFLCKGCGVCSVECPAMAITMHHFNDDQMFSTIRAALDQPCEKEEIRALAFFCNWCSYAGADLAGVSRFQYPPTTRIIRVMCSGRVDEKYILQAFMLGADGVLIGGCHPGDCHYISGNLHAEKRVIKLKKMLKEAGIEPERLRLEWISAGEGAKLAEVMTDFTAQLQKLGSNPLKREKLLDLRKDG